MELVITEVTEMGEASFCVAGWHPATRRMVRPIPARPVWLKWQLTRSKIRPGARIRFSAAAPECNGDYPHRTEDVRVDAEAAWFMDAGPASWFGQDAVPCASTFSTAFQGELRHSHNQEGCYSGCYIPAGMHARSLWAVRVCRKHLRFHESHGRLRVRVSDGSRHYDFPVSAHALKAVWRDGGIGAVNGSLPAQGDLHVRVGLARPYAGAPDKCYVMVNGVHW